MTSCDRDLVASPTWSRSRPCAKRPWRSFGYPSSEGGPRTRAGSYVRPSHQSTISLVSASSSCSTGRPSPRSPWSSLPPAPARPPCSQHGARSRPRCAPGGCPGTTPNRSAGSSGRRWSAVVQHHAARPRRGPGWRSGSEAHTAGSARHHRRGRARHPEQAVRGHGRPRAPGRGGRPQQPRSNSSCASFPTGFTSSSPHGRGRTSPSTGCARAASSPRCSSTSCGSPRPSRWS